MFGKIKLIAIVAIAGYFLFNVFSPSSGSSGPRLVDLDIVLDKMVDTFDELDGASDADAPATEINAETADDPAKTDQVLGLYHTKINEAGMMPDPIGVNLQPDGSILGFKDSNSDNVKDGAGDKDLFKVEIDVANSRLIATDLENSYVRESRFPVGGILTGYFIGRMLTGQRAAGITSSKFANTKSSPRGYHKQASAAAKSRARSSGGSRSFSSGK